MKNELQQPMCTQRQPRERLPEKQSNQLFVRLGSMYGHIFTSRWPTADLYDAAMAEWSIALGKFDADTLSAALRSCLDRYPKPPTLPEFYQLCRDQTASCAAHREYKQPKLTAPLCSEEKAKENLVRIKEMIGKALPAC